MTWTTQIAATLICCEMLLRLPVGRQMADMARASRACLHVARAGPASDHWKERLLLGSATRLLRASSLLLGFCAGLVLVFAATGLLTGEGPRRALAALAEPKAIAAVTLTAVLYLMLRGAFRRR